MITDKAKQLRNELKEKLNLSSRDVSVRVSSCYTSIDVSIKSRDIDLESVKSIAMKYRSVGYCVVSGETLSGGNTFVFVQYSSKC